MSRCSKLLNHPLIIRLSFSRVRVTELCSSTFSDTLKKTKTVSSIFWFAVETRYLLKDGRELLRRICTTLFLEHSTVHRKVEWLRNHSNSEVATPQPCLAFNCSVSNLTWNNGADAGAPSLSQAKSTEIPQRQMKHAPHDLFVSPFRSECLPKPLCASSASSAERCCSGRRFRLPREC